MDVPGVNVTMTTPAAPSRSRTVRLALWRAVKLTAFGAATWYLAVPQLILAGEALAGLAGIHSVVILTGAICAIGALFAYSQLTRTLLEDGLRPGPWHTLGIVTTSLGINRVMPGGAAAGSIMTFKLLEKAGIGRRRAAFAMATQSIGSAIVLNVLLWLALLVALPAYGFASSYVAAVVSGAVVFGVVALVIDALRHRRAWLWRASAALSRPLPRVQPANVTQLLDDQSERLVELSKRPGTLRRATVWAVLNWLLDAAALWIFLAAFGVKLNPVAVLVAFTLANVASLLPITPGGLGVVELALTATLASFGAAAVPAALGVAAYRVFNYWLPIPASAVAYLAVRRTPVAGAVG